MGLVLFYQLTASTPDALARTLLPRALAQGWRVMLRGTDKAALDRLDGRLWIEPEESFLPHGMEGGLHDADQPVLLGLGPALNAAKAVLLLDGAEPLEGEVENMERVWVAFDGANPDRLQAAREQWKRIVAQGHKAQYWSEESGRWAMKAER
ncbi:DNA polymerase III subunit chi [Neogemmobacter tilapiae]|uniref:DNA polymerase III subunit chi n=1 Tax=Neogemmobacter tilapiae TaxID=875041 RepID=A0A918WGY5_9RHOB|nr:DNA polymerase III subunit chi [Gemmobacter tilapiae]GHC45669.1 DNA polymerase III subunit chi [Gemmobacter tilapiae]